MNISNYTAYCGTGAPSFIANEQLFSETGTTIDPAAYTYTGYVRLKPGSATIATFTYSSADVDGVATLQLEIADTSAIPAGIYQHQTISTRTADSYEEVLLTGEIVFTSVL